MYKRLYETWAVQMQKGTILFPKHSITWLNFLQEILVLKSSVISGEIKKTTTKILTNLSIVYHLRNSKKMLYLTVVNHKINTHQNQAWNIYMENKFKFITESQSLKCVPHYITAHHDFQIIIKLLRWY